MLDINIYVALLNLYIFANYLQLTNAIYTEIRIIFLKMNKDKEDESIDF